MTRVSWPFLLVLMGLACLGGSKTAFAQGTGEPTDHSCVPIGINDTGVSTTVSTYGWNGTWTMGQFGSFWFQSWGRTPVRLGSSRASYAVLRERRGLLR